MKYYILQTSNSNKENVYFQEINIFGFPVETCNRDLARLMFHDTAVFYANCFNSAIKACNNSNLFYKVVEY